MKGRKHTVSAKKSHIPASPFSLHKTSRHNMAQRQHCALRYRILYQRQVVDVACKELVYKKSERKCRTQISLTQECGFLTPYAKKWLSLWSSKISSTKLYMSISFLSSWLSAELIFGSKDHELMYFLIADEELKGGGMRYCQLDALCKMTAAVSCETKPFYLR